MKKILKSLHPDEQKAIRALCRLYKKVEGETRRFARTTGIRCPSNCGICCATAKVETTPLEMLPLAADLWSRNKGFFWLKKLDAKPGARVCVFFKPDPRNKKNGRCGVYSLRPLICRLFGFSATKDKQGKAVYGGCKIIKKKFSSKFLAAQKIIALDPKFLKMSDLSARIVGLGSSSDEEILPINLSTRRALEKIGFILEKKQQMCKME